MTLLDLNIFLWIMFFIIMIVSIFALELSWYRISNILHKIGITIGMCECIVLLLSIAYYFK